MRAGWEWTFLRCCLGLAWLTTTVYVSIPDYPYGTPMWRLVAMDETGYVHELWYIAIPFVCMITLTYFWEQLRVAKTVLKRVVRRIEKDL